MPWRAAILLVYQRSLEPKPKLGASRFDERVCLPTPGVREYESGPGEALPKCTFSWSLVRKHLSMCWRLLVPKPGSGAERFVELGCNPTPEGWV